MSHEIYIDQNEFAHIAMTTGKPAWHSLGQSFDEGTLPSEAFEVAKVNDIVVEKEALYTKRDDVFHPVEDQVNLWLRNGEKNQDLGVVSEKYEIIQNKQLGQMLDKLGKYANVDVVGALFNGRVVFATFRGGAFDILLPNGNEDHHEMYLLFYSDRKPGLADQFILSPVRTVCWNTYRAAEDQSSINFKIRHTEGANETVEWTVDIFAGIASRQKALQDAMQMMALKPITDNQAVSLIDYAFPFPSKPDTVKRGELNNFHTLVNDDTLRLSEKEAGRYNKYNDALGAWEGNISRIKATRDYAVETYYGHETQKEIIGTVHGALNSVTYTTDHYGMGKGTGVKAARASVFGDRVISKIRAWEYASGLLSEN